LLRYQFFFCKARDRGGGEGRKKEIRGYSAGPNRIDSLLKVEEGEKRRKRKEEGARNAIDAATSKKREAERAALFCPAPTNWGRERKGAESLPPKSIPFLFFQRHRPTQGRGGKRGEKGKGFHFWGAVKKLQRLPTTICAQEIRSQEEKKEKKKKRDHPLSRGAIGGPMPQFSMKSIAFLGSTWHRRRREKRGRGRPRPSLTGARTRLVGGTRNTSHGGYHAGINTPRLGRKKKEGKKKARLIGGKFCPKGGRGVPMRSVLCRHNRRREKGREKGKSDRLKRPHQCAPEPLQAVPCFAELVNHCRLPEEKKGKKGEAHLALHRGWSWSRRDS